MVSSASLVLLFSFAAAEDTDSSSSGEVVIHEFCRRNYIKVDRLSILCDTPGAYYYGSSAYRNSQVCMSGDKANLDISCTFWWCLAETGTTVTVSLTVFIFYFLQFEYLME